MIGCLCITFMNHITIQLLLMLQKTDHILFLFCRSLSLMAMYQL
jgi:hypothetical protein